jgi:2-isopropylmalate synthase
MLAGHFHNDLGLATANTLAALEEGVPVVQCTVNGIGERAGNTAFEEVVMAIALNGEELGLRTDIDTGKLWSLSRLVSTLTGIGCAANKPVVGSNVFLTEAGIHQDGLLKHPDTYLPFRPERVGAPGFTCVLGKHSGRAAFGVRLAEMGFQLDREQLDRVIEIARGAPKEAWRNEAAVLSSAVAAVLARESNACTAGG